MNLIVATRLETAHIRLEAQGRWGDGDALKLAYIAKAAGLRNVKHLFLLDLLRVKGPDDSDAKFLICERLQRVFVSPVRVALLVAPALIDEPPQPGTGLAIAHFSVERHAVGWLVAEKRS